eukprot:11718706-Ditylum_brightwellii.AAC.1
MLPQYWVTWVEEHMVILASPSEEQSIKCSPDMRLHDRQIPVSHHPQEPPTSFQRKEWITFNSGKMP